MTLKLYKTNNTYLLTIDTLVFSFRKFILKYYNKEWGATSFQVNLQEAFVTI